LRNFWGEGLWQNGYLEDQNGDRIVYLKINVRKTGLIIRDGRNWGSIVDSNGLWC
jgi:hypothetical protein